MYLFSEVSAPNAMIISVGLRNLRQRRRLYENYGEACQTIRLIRGHSHGEKTLQEIHRMLGGRSVDFMFIDGDHTYHGAKKDFEIYSPFVRNGGIIAFGYPKTLTSTTLGRVGQDFSLEDIPTAFPT